MTDHDLPIGMLAMYARFAKASKSELFGFWYFGEMGIPSTKNEKKSFHNDLMAGRCCQLSLKGSLDQIWEIVSLTAQGQSFLPPYARLQEALTKHSPISVTFDDLVEAEGTSLEMNISPRLTESMESILAKFNSSRNVIELEIEHEWSLAKAMRECLS